MPDLNLRFSAAPVAIRPQAVACLEQMASFNPGFASVVKCKASLV
jgi:hypothetical protein